MNNKLHTGMHIYYPELDSILILYSLGETGTPTWATKLSLHNLIKKITPLITTEIYRNREFKIAMHVNILAITPFDHATDLPA